MLWSRHDLLVHIFKGLYSNELLLQKFLWNLFGHSWYQQWKLITRKFQAKISANFSPDAIFFKKLCALNRLFRIKCSSPAKLNYRILLPIESRFIAWAVYSTTNDPQPQMISRPQMIPKMDRKWSSTESDPQSRPQMIP